MLKQFLSFISIYIFLVSCNSEEGKISPEIEKITESVYASGIVKSLNQYEVFSKANGIAENIQVTEGDTVRQGDIIMRLSGETARLSNENARLAAEYASVAANQEKLNQARIEIDRARSVMKNDSMLYYKQQNLWERQIGTKNDLDQRKLAYDNSAKTYLAARLRYEDLRKQVEFQALQSKKNLELSGSTASDYTIRAGADGRVYDILVEEGEMVTMQKPVAVIGASDQFYLELQVDEYDIARISIGQEVLLTMDSYKDQVFSARIRKINPIMNQQTKSFTVEADFTKIPPLLYPNLTTEANIIIQVKERALTIPRDYLADDSSVILDNGDRRRISTGLKDYRKVEIISGLSESDVLTKPEP